jgi:predicted transcriptional regulator
VTRKSRKESRILTETELELMNILWKLSEGSVNDVLAELSKDRDLAYTSVSTILRILEQKGIIMSRKEGRGHVYIPKVKKEEYERTSVQHLVSNVFEGEASTLVRRLIETKDLSQKDLLELKQMLDQRLKK